MTDPYRDPDLRKSTGLRDVGAAARAAWRADEEEWTRAAFEAWEHERALVDVARDCMHRGDTVALLLSQRMFSGLVLAVGHDFVRIGRAKDHVDVQTGAHAQFILRVLAPARAGGSRGTTRIATFRACLLQLEADRVEVELGASVSLDAMVGLIRVGGDHVRLEFGDGGRAYVPIGSVSWVRPVDVD
jgi:hypothetical protein